MKFISFLLLICTQVLGHAKEISSIKWNCIVPDIISPPAAIDLKRTYLAKFDMVIGEFELSNFYVSSGLAIPLVRGPDGLEVTSDSAALEF